MIMQDYSTFYLGMFNLEICLFYFDIAKETMKLFEIGINFISKEISYPDDSKGPRWIFLNVAHWYYQFGDDPNWAFSDSADAPRKNAHI